MPSCFRNFFAVAPDWRLSATTHGDVHLEDSHLRIGPIVTNLTQNQTMHGQWGVYEQLGQYARAVAVPRMWAIQLRYSF